ncbi:MAG: insulinase family protein [Rhizobiaceae bacterium]|nr:insulinase family protein [Rhizobiaceae bacterium]
MRRSEPAGIAGFASAAIAGVFLLCATFAAQAAVKIQEVTSQSGVKAWLVEDYTVPIVSIRFAFDGGSASDPAGKDGLANLMTGLFDEGAGDLDSEAFQIRLDDVGAEMGFSASRDNIYGSMRMLAENRDAAIDLLRLAINSPRFDEAPIARIKSQIVAGIQSKENDPQTEAGRRWLRALYGDHAYARPDEGTPQTLASIGADDLRAFHKAAFARQGLHVAVVGAIDAATLKTDLDRLFSGLPERPELAPVPDVEQKLGQEIRYDYALPQTSLRLAYPGIGRDDPQFFAASLMNHILGGGTFTSRLFREVREKRGLTYGIDSGLVNYEHSAALVIGTQTRADKAAETLGIIRDVVAQMAKDGPTEAELEAAKKYVIGAYAINNLDSSGSIATTLVELQLDDLGIDYFERRVGLINAVTVEQTRDAARRLLSVEPAVLIVGPPSQPAKEAN